ncbi:unnamed protein product [Ectocarpus sp. CCAP 1310/34]|nr:unnamed protein product [Ectocarpus sp. CCAP 1310/34]
MVPWKSPRAPAMTCAVKAHRYRACTVRSSALSSPAASSRRTRDRWDSTSPATYSSAVFTRPDRDIEDRPKKRRNLGPDLPVQHAEHVGPEHLEQPAGAQDGQLPGYQGLPDFLVARGWERSQGGGEAVDDRDQRSPGVVYRCSWRRRRRVRAGDDVARSGIASYFCCFFFCCCCYYC